MRTSLKPHSNCSRSRKSHPQPPSSTKAQAQSSSHTLSHHNHCHELVVLTGYKINITITITFKHPALYVAISLSLETIGYCCLLYIQYVYSRDSVLRSPHHWSLSILIQCDDLAHLKNQSGIYCQLSIMTRF